MITARDFAVQAIEPVKLTAEGELSRRDLMSPFVWSRDRGGYAILVRGVPKGAYTEDTGQVWYGESDDGLSFQMVEKPVLTPGPDPLDAGGIEDPTLVLEKGRWIIYYTGVDAQHVSGQLLYATGSGPHDLAKHGVALASSKTEGNTKEATINRTPSGGWRLLYEYARNDASLIGMAIGEGVAGPWTESPQPFAPRQGQWDGWHLSTGPLFTGDPDAPVMFYNGATRDAHWRIGWIAFDREYKTVVQRCVEPLIAPAPHPELGNIDIAFAASCLAAGANTLYLYYSIGDRMLERATIRYFTA